MNIFLGSSNAGLRDFESENERWQLFDKCKGCYINDATVLVFPCRHLQLCRECAGTAEKCIVCNAHILQKTQIADNRADNHLWPKERQDLCRKEK